jgi:hypothetical protein
LRECGSTAAYVATRIELADGKVVQMVYGPISERKYFSITYAAFAD